MTPLEQLLGISSGSNETGEYKTPAARSISEILAAPRIGKPTFGDATEVLSTFPTDYEALERRTGELLSMFGDNVAAMFAIYVLANALTKLSTAVAVEIGISDPLNAIAEIAMAPLLTQFSTPEAARILGLSAVAIGTQRLGPQAGELNGRQLAQAMLGAAR